MSQPLNMGDLSQGDQDALRSVLSPDEYTWRDGLQMCLNAKGMRHLCALVISGVLGGDREIAKEMLAFAVLIEFGLTSTETGTAKLKPFVGVAHLKPGNN